MSLAGQDISALAVRCFDSAGSRPCLIGRAFLDLPVSRYLYNSKTPAFWYLPFQNAGILPIISFTCLQIGCYLFRTVSLILQRFYDLVFVVCAKCLDGDLKLHGSGTVGADKLVVVQFHHIALLLGND